MTPAATPPPPSPPAHHIVTSAVRLPERLGISTARNLGAFLAHGPTVLFVDGDTLLPPHLITDIAARATDTSVLLGFRHRLPYEVHQGGAGAMVHRPRLDADIRVVWHPPTGIRFPYSGITLPQPVDARPHRRLHAPGLWPALPRLGSSPHRCRRSGCGASRRRVGHRRIPTQIGGGLDDTYFGACLIAAGLLVTPLRQAVTFHLLPPQARHQPAGLADWTSPLTRYRSAMDRAAPSGQTGSFTMAMSCLLAACEVLR
jgi:hypothetical protein